MIRPLNRPSSLPPYAAACEWTLKPPELQKNDLSQPGMAKGRLCLAGILPLSPESNLLTRPTECRDVLLDPVQGHPLHEGSFRWCKCK